MTDDDIRQSPELGKQGGDVGAEIDLDLSTCVNPYGPPPSAIDALRAADPDLLRRHPFNAAAQIEGLYSERLDVAPKDVVATRGASEALFHLSHVLSTERVSLPVPTYTEYVRYFPKARYIPGDAKSLTIQQLDEAAHDSDAILFSNPHNPTGRYLSKADLLGVVEKNTSCLFIVDESYVDFVENDASPTLVGSTAENVLVVRSPTKFFGLGGVRVGAIWTRDAKLRSAMTDQRSTWPVSGLDVYIVAKALSDTAWQAWARMRLDEDAKWLDHWLFGRSNIETVPGPLHFRLITGKVDDLERKLASKGIAIRLLNKAHGVGEPAARIAAPAESERRRLEEIR